MEDVGVATGKLRRRSVGVTQFLITVAHLAVTLTLLWSPYGIGQTIIFSSCFFFFLLFLFPRLISAVRDWMSTILPQSTHGVALVRI